MITRLLRICALVLLLLTAGTYTVSAMIVESGDTIVIDSATSQDIYLIAGTVIINAPLHGDLVVAGGKIYINDTVNNVLLAGGTIVINGFVAGKIRCFGGKLEISRNVIGDIAAAGGEIVVDNNATVSGDILMAGSDLSVYGYVDGLIHTAAGNFSLYGTAGKGLDCRGGRILIDGKVMGPARLAVSENLTIGAFASFESSVRYWAPEAVNFANACKKGPAILDGDLALKHTHWYFWGYFGWIAFLCYLASAFLMIIILQFLLPALFRTAANKIYENTLRSFGFGILFFIATPILIAISFLSIVAIPVGLALMLVYIFCILICGCITALVAAHWLASLGRSQDPSFWKRIWIAFLCFIALRAILSIPLFGWIIFPIMVFCAFGALLSSIHWKRFRSHADTLPPATTPAL